MRTGNSFGKLKTDEKKNVVVFKGTAGDYQSVFLKKCVKMTNPIEFENESVSSLVARTC